MEYSHALVSEKRPTSLLMDRSALLQAVRHPARDHVGAHPVQCVWLSDLWAGPSAPHSTLGVMLRSVEASVQDHQLLRPSTIRAVDQGEKSLVDDADGQVS